MAFTISTETRIEADPATVWSVLTTVEAWPLWTSRMRIQSGDLAKGKRLRVSVAQPRGGHVIHAPRITAIVPARRLQWVRRTALPGIFDSKRDFVLTETESGATTLLSKEVFSGLLAPLLRDSTSVREAEARFEGLNGDIKARAEDLRGV
ncbi:SRPBCC domain-containing protein [Oceanibium sediminis]|uniref:SRPBCC domain-containing protein n=1 Tax=Oceanibium sediminis TaxID=2026339 RepID=UPI000DD4AC24|nr:SRPBCC domain-containing protein [Oceanibium sediminis]